MYQLLQRLSGQIFTQNRSLIREIIFCFLLIFSSFFVSYVVMSFKVWNVDSTIYFIFTLFSFFLLASSMLKPFSEFIFLLNFLFFLGFWVKTTHHILSGLDFLEACRGFSIQNLNRAMMDFVEAAIILSGLSIFVKQIQIKPHVFKVPGRWKNTILSVLLLLIISYLAYLNWHIGFLRVGLSSGSSVIFPVSALYSWLLGPGAAFLVFLLLSESYTALGTLSTLLIMFSVSVSTLSRNSLMYFAYPLFVKFFTNRPIRKQSLIHSLISVVFFIFALVQISQLRLFTAEINLETQSFLDLSRMKEPLAQLFFDRWVGIEGVVVAESEKSDENFKTMIFENHKTSPTSIYYYLSGSNYALPDKYLYYTFPGPIGLINLADSLLYKAAGYLFFSLILFMSYFCLEKYFIGFAKSSVSWWATAMMTQISIFPVYNLSIYFSYVLIMIIIITILKKKVTQDNSRYF